MLVPELLSSHLYLMFSALCNFSSLRSDCSVVSGWFVFLFFSNLKTSYLALLCHHLPTGLVTFAGIDM